MLQNIAACLSIAFAALRTEHCLPRLEMLEHAFKVPNTASFYLTHLAHLSAPVLPMPTSRIYPQPIPSNITPRPR